MTNQDLIENKTFDAIAIGEQASLIRTLTRADIDLFAIVSGDINPTHVDEQFFAAAGWEQVSGHSMWAGSL